MSIPRVEPQVKTQSPPQSAPGFVRCAGCYNWTNSYKIELTAEAIGFALCDRCQGPCDEWRWDELIRNVCAYTGGEVWTL